MISHGTIHTAAALSSAVCPECAEDTGAERRERQERRERIKTVLLRSIYATHTMPDSYLDSVIDLLEEAINN